MPRQAFIGARVYYKGIDGQEDEDFGWGIEYRVRQSPDEEMDDANWLVAERAGNDRE